MHERQENIASILRSLGTALLLGLFFLIFSSHQDQPVTTVHVSSHFFAGSDTQLDNPAAIIRETTHPDLLNYLFSNLPAQGNAKIAGEVHPGIECSNHNVALMLKHWDGSRIYRKSFLHQKHCPQPAHQNGTEPPVLI